MDSTFVLHGSKSAHFLSPLEFVSGPPQEVGLTQIPGGCLAKILTTNHFLFFKIISEWPLSLMARFFTHFMPSSCYYSFPLFLLKDFTCIFQIHFFLLLHVSLKIATVLFFCFVFLFFFFSVFLLCIYCNRRYSQDGDFSQSQG
jgi:hypothetical protein